MSNFDATDVLFAGLGVGGFLWFNHKLTSERRARIEAEVQRDCARTCGSQTAKPANGRPTARPASAPRLAPRTFDQVFAAYGHGIPVPYLRALALRESNLNPQLSSGPAWGLLQVIEVVRQDYNQRTGATFTRKDLLDPAVNVTIASSALALIVKSYAQNHPRVPNLQANWTNPRFIELLTFGWLCARAHNPPYAKSGVMRARSELPPFLVGWEQVEAEGRSHNA
ncbi:MAG: transglycosylase SLT domain-containing protein [Deltaproteobacteria bacterium]|nr:transglycosylase SLT domain-containing protein [Deltaproteobacteria bacterium]